MARIAPPGWNVNTRAAYYKNPKTDILNNLGIDYNEYKNKLLQIAFSNSREYFQHRQNLHNNLIKNAILSIYELVFNALTRGFSNAGDNDQDRLMPVEAADVATRAAFNAQTTVLSPQFSSEEANRVAVSVAQGLKKILEEKVAEVLLPQNIYENSLQRAKARMEANLLGN